MERRRMRRKPAFGKRIMVTMLSLVMLLSMLSPGLLAGADETTTDPTVQQTPETPNDQAPAADGQTQLTDRVKTESNFKDSFIDAFMDAYDQQTQNGGEQMGSLALSYIAKYDMLKARVQALDPAAEDHAAQVEALNAEIAALDAAIAASAANGELTDAEVASVRAAAVGSVTASAPAVVPDGAKLTNQTVTAYESEMTFAVTGKLPEGVSLSVRKLDGQLAAFIRSDVLGLGALPAGYTGAAYDIKLMLDGAEIQPAEAVTLGITASGITSKADVNVYHLPGTSGDAISAVSGSDLHGLTAEKIANVNCYDEGYYAFFTNGFSVYYISTGNLNAEVDEEKSYLVQIAELKTQAEALDTEAEDYEDQWWAIYDANAAVMDEATLAWENDEMTDEEYAEVYYAYEDVISVLGEDPYAKDTREERNIKYYRSDVGVYWDEASGSGTSATSKTGSSNNNIVSVKLNGTDVIWGNSNLGSGWASSPLTVGTYYPAASTSNNQSVKLTITPKAGYYVTHITVACCPSTVKPFNCSTWQAGNAYETNLSVTASGSVSIDLAADAFCHDNNNKEKDHQYFILIVTAPLPSPLWVEYDYGNIGTYITNAGGSISGTPFATAEAWTDDNTNYYGSATSGNGVMTNDTQMKYIYASGDTTDAAKWTHTTNTVTEAAKLKAAEYGYYFAGWRAQYYEDCSETANAEEAYNNYTYTFADAYGSAFSVSENTPLQLVTNVRLVAQWAPIELTVTKTVVGLPSGSTTHTLAVSKDSEEYKTATLTVTGSNSSSEQYYPVTPGQYSVTETETTETVDVNGTTYYLIDTEYSAPVTVTAENIANGTTTEINLTVKNTYSNVPDEPVDKPYIVAQKIFEGITDASLISDNFCINVGDYTLFKNTAIQSVTGEGYIVLTWTLNNVSAGTYNVTEENEEIDDYNVTTSGLGNVTTKAAAVTLTQTGHVPNCNSLSYTVPDATYIYASLTQNAGYFLWTEKTLSANERAAFASKIGTNESKIYFYSGDKLTDADGMIFRGETIKYDQGSDLLTFSATRQWSQFWYGTYNSTANENPEVKVVNTYTPATTTVTISKEVTGNMGDINKDFEFTVTSDKAVTVTENLNGYSVSEGGKIITFNLKDNESVTIAGVPIGANLTVTEKNEPYTVTITVGETTYKNGDSIPVTNATSISVNNHYDVSIDTGINLNSFPFIMMLSSCIVMAVFFLIGKKRMMF